MKFSEFFHYYSLVLQYITLLSEFINLLTIRMLEIDKLDSRIAQESVSQTDKFVIDMCCNYRKLALYVRPLKYVQKVGCAWNLYVAVTQYLNLYHSLHVAPSEKDFEGLGF